jgi:hypothetical protein
MDGSSLTKYERTKSILGEDFWPYRPDANYDTLQTFLSYAHEQGIVSRKLDPAERFAATCKICRAPPLGSYAKTCAPPAASIPRVD